MAGRVIPRDVFPMMGIDFGEVFEPNYRDQFYPLIDDAGALQEAFVGLPARKCRIDRQLPQGMQRVHYLEIQGRGERLPLISTALFFRDFFDPAAQEQGRVQQMIEALRGRGIHAAVCNGFHHAIIFYREEGHGGLMSPRDFAYLLASSPATLGIIEAAAHLDVDINAWKEAYVEVFGGHLRGSSLEK